MTTPDPRLEPALTYAGAHLPDTLHTEFAGDADDVERMRAGLGRGAEAGGESVELMFLTAVSMAAFSVSRLILSSNFCFS